MNMEVGGKPVKEYADAYKMMKDKGDIEVWTGLRIWKEGEELTVNADAGKTTYQMMDWDGDGASTIAATALTLLASAVLLQ